MTLAEPLAVEGDITVAVLQVTCYIPRHLVHTVASTATKVIMIEAGANEIPEAKMIEAIYKCHDVNQTVIAFINKIREEVGKPKHAYTSCAIPEEMFAAMREIVTPEQMEEAVFTDEKQQREENIREITDKFAEAFAENEVEFFKDHPEAQMHNKKECFLVTIRV